MAGLEELRNVLHVIRAWLYPNYLEHGGKFIARARTIIRGLGSSSENNGERVNNPRPGRDETKYWRICV